MSLNQLLYNGPGIVNHRPWLDVKVNSLQFNVGGTQSLLDFYSAPAAAVNLVFTHTTAPNTNLDFKFARIGKLVIGNVNGSIEGDAGGEPTSTTNISTDFRPSSSVTFAIPSYIDTNDWGAMLTFSIDTAGTVVFGATEGAATPQAVKYNLVGSTFCYSV